MATYAAQPVGGQPPRAMYIQNGQILYHNPNAPQGPPRPQAGSLPYPPPGAYPGPGGYPPPGAYPQQGAYQVTGYGPDGQPLPQQQQYVEPPTGKWRDEIFDLFNNIAPSCLGAWCCGCFALGQIANKIQWRWRYWHIVGLFVVLSVTQFIINLAARDPQSRFIGVRTLSVIMFLIGFGIALALRQEIRKRFTIPGSGITDCLLSFFCQCCTVAQMMRHLWFYRQSFEHCNLGPDMV